MDEAVTAIQYREPARPSGTRSAVAPDRRDTALLSGADAERTEETGVQIGDEKEDYVA